MQYDAIMSQMGIDNISQRDGDQQKSTERKNEYASSEYDVNFKQFVKQQYLPPFSGIIEEENEDSERNSPRRFRDNRWLPG